ncbi:DUF3180 domain-containing protein [Corynebacterium uterequi]|uniref:Putative DUF3180 family protein n=1 Tax=Corynebacterium uterequi TaxID=1072256 RepID=A0A0G3HIV7_9CORY|nr:DUF3180 domain-containing protein [Corynebacterium uterequi]AKK11873.1 putative DUF3180 family protein [Corynebacterium uterequi]
MIRTPIAGLVVVYAFIAAAVGIVTCFFYSYFPPLPAIGPVTLWALVAMCVGLRALVRRNLDEGRIGLDRSQLNPLTVARILVVGQASAWTGAIMGGGYAGVATFVVPHAGQLVTAQAELPVVLAGALGGAVLAAAGVAVEKSCETPPPGSGETIS